EHVGVPRLQGAHAPFALFAVAEAEALVVEQPDGVEDLPLEIEADADADGQARVRAARARLDQPAERVDVPARGKRVRLQEAWERADGGVVRERRHRGDL